MPEIDMGEFSSFSAALAAIDEKQHPDIKNYITPWWGNKQTESGNLNNRGYVIGFRNEEKSAQWRLDYDDKKKLHINWTQEVTGKDTKKECYRIFSLRPTDTMWEYYIGWTRQRYAMIPADIKELLDKTGGAKSWNGRYWSS